jgi:hypothetical protein
MRIALLIVLLSVLSLQLTFGWSDEEYAKIKVAAAKRPDTATATGSLLNESSKAADMAMYYRQQGNTSQADLWLAVAWEEFLQSQPPDPSKTEAAGTKP